MTVLKVDNAFIEKKFLELMTGCFGSYEVSEIFPPDDIFPNHHIFMETSNYSYIIAISLEYSCVRYIRAKNKTTATHLCWWNKEA